MEKEVIVGSVDPAVAESLYSVIGLYIATVLVVIFAVIIIFRYCKAFYDYIHTGEFGDSDDCFIYQLVEDQEITIHTLTGTHPVATLLDGFVFIVIAALSQFIWGAMLFIGGIILVAQILRKRIAKKQEFMSRLEGTHPDTNERTA